MRSSKWHRNSLNIENFGIEDQTQLFEIAKVCVQQNGGLGSQPEYLLKNFRIKEQEQLYRLPSSALSRMAGETANNFRKFKIEDKELIFEIAKVCAKQDAGGNSRIYRKLRDRRSGHNYTKLPSSALSRMR